MNLLNDEEDLSLPSSGFLAASSIPASRGGNIDGFAGSSDGRLRNFTQSLLELHRPASECVYT